MQIRRFSCKLTSLLVLGALVVTPLVLDADTVILKSGKKIQCEVIGYRAGKLTLRKPDGKIMTGSISAVAEIQFSRPIHPPDAPAEAPAEAPATDPATPSAESPSAPATMVTVATAPDAPPDAPPDALPDAPDTNAPAVEVAVVPVEAEPPKPKKPLHEYKTVSEILRALPAELQPHKEAWKKNPLMRTKMEDWFDKHAVGSRLTLPARELLGVDPEGYVTIELRPFSVGTIKYKCDSGIRCRYWSAIPADSDKYLLLLRELKEQGKTLPDHYAVKNKEKAVIDARLSRLRIGKRDAKGRAIRRGSRIAVSGLIRDLEVSAFMEARPPHVRVAIELIETTIKE